MEVVMQHKKIILSEFWSHLHLCESEVGFWLWFLLLVLQKGGWSGAPLSFKEKSSGDCVTVGEKKDRKNERELYEQSTSLPHKGSC